MIAPASAGRHVEVRCLGASPRTKRHAFGVDLVRTSGRYTPLWDGAGIADAMAAAQVAAGDTLPITVHPSARSAMV